MNKMVTNNVAEELNQQMNNYDEYFKQRYIIFEVNKEYLAIGLSYVKEIIEIEKIREIPKLSAKFEGIIHLRENIIPILNFNYCIFNKSDFADENQKSNHNKIIIIRTSIGEFGILVDWVDDIIELTTENFENLPTAVKTEIPINFIENMVSIKNRNVKILDLPVILSKKFGLDEFSIQDSDNTEGDRNKKVQLNKIAEKRNLLLSDEQKDALKEISNIASGKAVTALSNLMKSKSKIDIQVQNVIVQELFELSMQNFDPGEIIIGIRAILKNDLNGVIFLMFSIEELTFLAEDISGTSQFPKNIQNVNDLDQNSYSTFQEIGNIIISHYASGIADFLSIDLYHEVPQIAIGEYTALIDIELAKLARYSDQAIFMQTNIVIKNKEINGDIIFIPYYESMNKFVEWLDADHIVKQLNSKKSLKKDIVKVKVKSPKAKSKKKAKSIKKDEKTITKEIFNKVESQDNYKIKPAFKKELNIKESDLNAFQELGNIAAGNAGNALSQMLNKKVYLEIPPVKILELPEVVKMFDSNEKIVGYIGTTKGFFDANIFLMFKTTAVENLLSELMGEKLTKKLTKQSDLTKPEKSCIVEISNILIGHYLSAISDFLKIMIEPPKYQFFFGGSRSLFSNIEKAKGSSDIKAIIVETNIQVAQDELIKGNFVLLLSSDIVSNVLDRISQVW
jgi:chemotaxis protein CheY-P-specific phosphatase CheC/chemotaxis signal transduction protein